MIDTTIQVQLLKQVDQLTLEEQHRVLDFASSLSKAHNPTSPPKHFMELFGTLDSESAKEMNRAIEKNCK